MVDSTFNQSIFEKFKISNLKIVDHLSYWQYLSLNECKLKGLYPQGVFLEPNAGFRLGSRRMLLGTVFHEMIKEVSKVVKVNGAITSKDIKEISSRVLAGIENKANDDISLRKARDISSWPESGLLLKALENVSNQGGSNRTGNLKVISEEKVVSKRHNVVGKPDLVIVGKDYITLIDYKFGEIEHASSEVVEKYENQLQLYSILLKEKYGNLPVYAFLIDKNGRRKEVHMNQTVGMDIVYNMNVQLDEINRLIDASNRDYEKIATPSSSSCGYCRLTPWCSEFKKNMKDIELPKRNHIIFGWQESNIVNTRRAGTILKVRPQLSSFSNQNGVISITRVNLDWFPLFKDIPGQPLIVTNLKADTMASSSTVTFETEIFSFGEEC